MKKVLFTIFLSSMIGMIQVSAQNSLGTTPDNVYTVSETLKLLKGQWRYMYKLIDDQVFYNHSFGSGKAVIDTMEIHTYEIEATGETRYYTDWEDKDGSQALNAAGTRGSWDLEKSPDGVVIVLRDAFFKGCPDIRRKEVMINDKQMLLLDEEMNDKYYFKRKTL